MFCKVFFNKNKKKYIFSENSEKFMINNINYIVCGDIKLFNKPEITTKLSIKKFKSDLHIALLYYIEKGSENIFNLYGDFAFSILNESNNELFFVRDLTSNKKIFYNYNNKHITLSLNLNLILKDKDFKKELNENKLINDISDLGINNNETYYKNTFFLQRREYGIVKNGILKLKNNYSIPQKTIKYKLKEDYFNAFNEIFNNSIKNRISNEKKIGIMLSGGIDSTTTAHQISLVFPNKSINTYTHIPKHYTKSLIRTNNESKLVNEFLKHHKNLNPQFIITDDHTILKSLEKALRIHPEPIRNAINLHWLLDINNIAQKNGIDILINAQKGNETISWPSHFYYNRYLRRDSFNGYVKYVLLKLNLLDNYYTKKNNQKYIKNIIENTTISEFTKQQLLKVYKSINYKNYRQENIFNENTGTFNGDFSPKRIDLSMDIKLIEFLYNLPNHFYSNINESFIKQYLSNKIPNSIIYNNKKGLQSSDIVIKLSKERKNIEKTIEKHKNNYYVSKFYNTKNINFSKISLKDLNKIIFLSKF